MIVKEVEEDMRREICMMISRWYWRRMRKVERKIHREWGTRVCSYWFSNRNIGKAVKLATRARWWEERADRHKRYVM